MKSIPVSYAYKFASIKGCKFWIPKPFYVFEGAFEVSVPTVAFKLSYLRHFLSEKYFKMATEKKPEIIADIMNKILTGELQNTLPYKEYHMKITYRWTTKDWTDEEKI
jgi:hypothetical protein